MIYYELIPQEAYDMKSQISWKVGGQQGEGIESTGEIFATAMNRKGYYLYGYRHFSSRIKVDILITKLEYLLRLYMQSVMI